jgi:hypothetical protein
MNNMHNNFYNSNQSYMYSVTGKNQGHLLIKPDSKPIFVNSCINYNGLFIVFNKNINTFYWNNSQLHVILLYVLFKTEQKATDSIIYKHKTFVAYL